MTPPLPTPLRECDAADRARDVAERRHHALRPRRGRVEAVEVVLPGERLGAVGFVQVEEFGRAADRDVAAAAAKAGNADALRHVLAVVPLVEVVARFRQEVVPDRDDAQAREAHGLLQRSWCRVSVTTSVPRSP